MSDKFKINLQLSERVNDELEVLASARDMSKADIVRQALALMKVAYEANKNGKFVGIVDNPEKLDVEITGIK